MNNRFYISDTHFGHANILTFEGPDGQKVREFNSVEEMDETMVERWNAVVGPHDTVYHLGDVAIKRKSLGILPRLNGRKILVKGNHDIFKMKDYAKHFKDIRSYLVYPEKNTIFSHMPIVIGHEARFQVNVHGHTHSYVMPDPRYINICVEQINYTPLHQDQIFGMIDNATVV